MIVVERDNENIFDVKLQKKGRYIVVLEIFYTLQCKDNI